MPDPRDFFEELVYKTVGGRRFTQQSPVMPDVWIKYALFPGEPQDLLMVPSWHNTPDQLAKGLKARLKADRTGEDPKSRVDSGGKAAGSPDEASDDFADFDDFDDADQERPSSSESTRPVPDLSEFRDEKEALKRTRVAHNQNAVAASLYFDELIRGVLPLSEWWRDSVAVVKRPKDRDRLAEAARGEGLEGILKGAWRLDQAGTSPQGLTLDLAWLAQVAGLIAHISTKSGRSSYKRLKDDTYVGKLEELVARARKGGKNDPLAPALARLLTGIAPVHAGDLFPLYTVNLNRESSRALTDSVAAVKADASTRLFSVTGEGVSWAVIDSGIDARHVAFRKRDEDGSPRLRPFERPRRRRGAGRGGDHFTNSTRVVATYDFVKIWELLGAEPGEVDNLTVEEFPTLAREGNREKLKAFLKEYDQGVIDWHGLEPLLRIPHNPHEYRPPNHAHGTHVAGILGADWRMTDEDADLEGPSEDIRGVCPDIELYDLRVLNDQGMGNEFAIMSAMQFVRALNNKKDFVAIHGVNLSLSIPHDVANYACGRTPVCEEAERLVGAGIVVVAAAGNSGRARYLTPSNEIDEGFRTVSITDPGNAAAVITVGSTHRRDPHTYGVSYFSSRGPTGDGRAKPDLVAPGEKIRSTVPGDRHDLLDGTSMSAPHVSGAAALLMARYSEFIGQPERIKEMLCRTATDLGRERYFQGAGMLDILRALQSI